MPFIFASGKTQQYIYCKSLTHMTNMEFLLYLSWQSHILENSAIWSHGWIGSLSVNKTPIDMDSMIYAFNCSSNPLINDFAQLFINISCWLLQWSRDSWYIPYCMNILQPNIIWWHYVIFLIVVEEVTKYQNH